MRRWAEGIDRGTSGIQGSDPVGRRPAVVRRSDRARPAPRARGPGAAGRLRDLPLRRAPGHRRPRRPDAGDLRARGGRRGRGRRTRRIVRGGGRPRGLQLRAVVRLLPVLRVGPLEPVRQRRPAPAGPAGRRDVAPPRARPGPPDLPAARHLRPPHRGARVVVREGPAGGAAGQGVPGRLRGHDRLGQRGLRRRRATGRQGRRRRPGRGRLRCGPGRGDGRRRADLRHRPDRLEAAGRARVRGHPHRRRPGRRRGADRAGDVGPPVRQGHPGHGRRRRRADGAGHGHHRQAGAGWW